MNPALRTTKGTAMEWEPIETAPKDGTPFLATDGRYYEVLNQPPGCELGVWAETRPGSGVWSGSCVRNIDPTHWMPLPPLPHSDS
jgi:hypothetical protein